MKPRTDTLMLFVIGVWILGVIGSWQYTQTSAGAQGELKKLIPTMVATVISGVIGTVLGHIWPLKRK